MKTIRCRSIYGNPVDVPVEQMQFRIGVYAVVLRGDAVLLVINHSTGRYALPGGGVERGEGLEDALRREVREEAGLEIEIVRFLAYREDLFYYDPKDEAFHSLQMYFLCRPVGEAPAGFTAQDDESEAGRWVDWRDCAPTAFNTLAEHDLIAQAVSALHEGG